jgi:hypothetical protein
MDGKKIKSLDDITPELFAARIAGAFLELRGSNLTVIMFKAFPEFDEIDFDGMTSFEELMQLWERLSGKERTR